MDAIILGTGNALKGKVQSIDTEYGKSKIIEINGKIFLPRHGINSSIAPHKINYKANIRALEKLGINEVLLIYSAGIISDYEPGDLVEIEDYIGLFTPISFTDKHTTMNNALKKIDKPWLKKGGVIVTTKGPRLETPAEIRALKSMGANLVNMTSAYEISLLNELGIRCSAIAMAANYAGSEDSEEKIRAKSKEMMKNLFIKLGLE